VKGRGPPSPSLSKGQTGYKKEGAIHDRFDIRANTDHFFLAVCIIRTGLREALTMIDILGSVIGLLLIVYLFITVLRPEKF
jgi:K+-transporting ATPase KdpF subunit